MISAGTAKARFEGLLLAACLATLAVGSALALHAAWRWPLVGDSALIRYVVLLIQAGKTPYAQIADINLPGSYLLEALAMKCFGWDAIGLRCYDGFLCLTFCLLAYLLPSLTSLLYRSQRAKPAEDRRERLACLGGGLLFLLIHLQDGLTEAGQRDLALAVLLLAGVVVLAHAPPRPLVAVFCFELLAGATLTVKPTLWPMALLPWLLVSARSKRAFLASLCGLLAAPAIAAAWLLRTGALPAFVRMAGSIGALHGRLGRHGAGFLLAHCTAPVTVLFVLWLIVLATQTLERFGNSSSVVARSSPSSSSGAKDPRILREPARHSGHGAVPTFDLPRRLLLAATLCGLLSYLEQGKGLSYQRYPFLGLALVLIGLDLSRACRLPGATTRHRIAYAASVAALVCTMLWFAPRFTMAVRGFDTTQPFEDHLAQSLRHQPGSVQCLDTFGGCIDTLYQLRAVQATGYLYDCYLFTPPSATRDRYREQFLRSFNAAHPQTVVLTNQPCFDPARNYDRLASWPQFNQQLNRDYRLREEWHTDRTYRWWSRWERPIAYRAYELR